MAVTQISITRGLKELKLLDDRIRKAIVQPFIGVRKGTSDESAEVVGISGVKVKDYEKTLAANFDKAEGLFKYRAELKGLIIKSNAATIVTLGGKDMTVAEAIEYKSHIELRRIYLAQLITQSRQAQDRVELGNEQLTVRIDTQINTVLSKEKSSSNFPALRAEIVDPIERAGKLSLIDPFTLSQKAKATMEEIDTFVTEVDFVLSESNSKTVITIDNGAPAVTVALPPADVVA